MYRYDTFDQRIVDERVAQFRDQTRRFLAGELTEDEFRPLRLQNGLYIQRHAPMLRDRRFRTACCRRGSCACSRTSRASTTAATATSPRARTSSSTGRSSRTCPTSSPSSRRCEMHAIQTQRQLRPQHHHRPLRRRRARRDRRSASVVRARAPVVDVPSRSSPTCRASSRSRSPARPPTARRSLVHDIGLQAVRNDARRGRLPRARRRRPGPHADHRPRDPRVPAVASTCSPTSTRSCASTTATAAATTCTRRASRSW